MFLLLFVCFLFRQLWILRYIKYVPHTQACLNFFISFDLMPFLLQNRFLCSTQERTCFKGGNLSIWHRYGKQLFCCNFLLIKILSPEGRTESHETQERDIPHKSQKDETYEIHNASFECYISRRTAGKRHLSGLTSEFPV